MYQRILVPIDGRATAARGLAEAIQLARTTGGRRRLIHGLTAAASASGQASVTRQIGLPTSSATSKHPPGPIATPTGRP